MKDKVIKLLEEKVNDIFFEMQEELGIESGDITPLGVLELDKRTEELAEIITLVLENQKSN